ncbi:hypothetical protein PQX77_019021, partial [Marasmius sp. AFHP31]
MAFIGQAQIRLERGNPTLNVDRWRLSHLQLNTCNTLLEPFVVHAARPHLKVRKLSMNRNAELEGLEEYLRLILADKSKRQDLLSKEGDSAQQWLDRMQQ